jgi:hypothetical protein
MSNYTSFQFSLGDYTEELTSQTHQTIYWLANNGYLTKDQSADLVGSLVVTAISNKKGWGQRIKERFFGVKEEENVWVFPIVKLEDWTQGQGAAEDKARKSPKGKPNLTVVKDE